MRRTAATGRARPQTQVLHGLRSANRLLMIVSYVQVDPTSKPHRTAQSLQASISALLGATSTMETLRAQQALPRNHSAHAQV